ncbi:tRNA(Ile)-lysidine synthase [Corynebacterium ulcerans]|nr:cell cycle protein MesJ [Corynebacterium ulcerans 809]AIT89906.1 tRNA(Ile)-lysidine synthase [Corynebacterium ulcerans]AIU31254.1 tRNA(Ile)-lysidine synthase [Corynebacterium ulcerans]AIU92524.1 tRNA(Ile)-lysidine synthase [Corynebacterium ulcerans]ALD95701.1 tRNA(Ile)-lysidine synthase [Corynebacterium ulcerans]
MFWPRKSPRFMACRVAVRAVTDRDVVVGLSGGPDSLALVAALVAEKYRVLAVCVDHGLQQGSERVAERAAETVRGLGAEATVVQVDVEKSGSLEANARRARYEALRGFGKPVVVGHTADDQAETLLLGALRGKAAGMLVQGTVWRPFLSVRRADTVGACAELGLEPWHDPHNDQREFRRVAIRQQVLPLLSDIIGGDPVPALARAAMNIAHDDEALQVSDATLDELRAAHPAFRRRYLAAFLRENKAPVTGANIDAVERLVTDWHGQGGVAVGNRLEVIRKDGKLLSKER